MLMNSLIKKDDYNLQETASQVADGPFVMLDKTLNSPLQSNKSLLNCGLSLSKKRRPHLTGVIVKPINQE